MSAAFFCSAGESGAFAVSWPASVACCAAAGVSVSGKGLPPPAYTNEERIVAARIERPTAGVYANRGLAEAARLCKNPANDPVSRLAPSVLTAVLGTE